MAAKTLEGILEHPQVEIIRDRSQPIRSLIPQVLSDWEPDLTTRKPSRAYAAGEEGVPILIGTDLDLFSVLMELSRRRAVINIPEYERLRANSLRSNQCVIANENRHGHIIRLISNTVPGTHAFSVLIRDYNVAEERKHGEIVGVPRNFAITDDNGQFYKGWRRIEWKATPRELEFIRERGLEAFKETVAFKYFVHPALANAFYGSRYLVAKILAMRIVDQASFYSELAKNLREEGIRLPPPDEDELSVSLPKGEDVPIKVVNLEARLLMSELKGQYPIFGVEEFHTRDEPKVKLYDSMPTDKEGKREVLRYAAWIHRKLTRKYGPMVRGPVRAVELAFFLYGFRNPEVKEPGTELKPGWAVPEWQQGYKQKRTAFNMLEINPYVRLLYRIRETTARVNPATYREAA